MRKKKKEKIQNTYQELMRGITTDKKIISRYYEQIYTDKFVNLNEKKKLKL